MQLNHSLIGRFLEKIETFFFLRSHKVGLFKKIFFDITFRQEMIVKI